MLLDRELILIQIDRLYEEFDDKCEDVAADCEKEGHLPYGLTWDLRCSNLWEWCYKPEIDYLETRLAELRGDTK